MTHKSVRLLPKAVDLAAMQDTLPRESHASVLQRGARCTSSQPGQLPSSPPRLPCTAPSSLSTAQRRCQQRVDSSLVPTLI